MIRTEDYKQELISIVFAQKHLIFWSAFLIFVGAVGVAFFWPPTYSATGSVLLTSKQVFDRDSRALQNSESRAISIYKEDIASEIKILTSPQTVQNALATLVGKYPALRLGRKDEAVATVSDVISNMNTMVVPATNVIEIQYLNRSAAMAADVLNALMSEYLVQRGKLYARKAQTPAKLFADEAERYREGVRVKDDEMVSLLNEKGGAEPKIEIEANLKLKTQLELDLNALKKERADVSQALTMTEKALADNDVQYFAFLDNPTVREIAIRLSALYVERGNLLRIYQPEHDAVVALTEQVTDNLGLLKREVGVIRESYGKKLQSVNSQIKDIETQIVRYDDKNMALAEQIVAAQRIAREAEVMRSSFETYAKRADEVAINNTLASDEPMISVKIIDAAFPSKGPVFPKRSIVLPLGLLVGLLTGCSLGFVREYFDHTFKKPSDVAAYAGLPVLFSLSRPPQRSLDMLYSLVIAALIIGTGIFVVLNL
jgi:uncharacterized protein involved in exopolysaccharide biosynthesis